MLVYDYYGIDSSRLAFTSSYWVSSAPDFRISGPQDCELIAPRPSDCVAIDASRQQQIASEAAGAYWWILVMSQVFHIFMCKTRFASLKTHGLFNNVVMWYGVAIEGAMILIFIFVPRLNELLVGLPFPGKIWPLFLVSWGCFFAMAEGRKYLGRRQPEGFVAKYLNW